MMRVSAKLSYAPISAQKCRLVANVVRGKSVGSALQTLNFMPKKGAAILKKVLESAIANAEHNFALDRDELFVAEAYADEGPTLKRWRPRARGRATQIRKRTCHITIVVADETVAVGDREEVA